MAEKRPRSEVRFLLEVHENTSLYVLVLILLSVLFIYIRIPILDNLLQGKYRINADDKNRR